MAPVTTLFLIGRPGSGKSTIARILRDRLPNARLFDERPHLLTVASDPAMAHLARTDGRDITVCNPAVYEITLHRLLDEIAAESRPGMVCITEFARRDYAGVLGQFAARFKSSWLAVYVAAPFDTCAFRNVDRARTGGSSVPEAEMRAVFQDDDWPEASSRWADQCATVRNDTPDGVALAAADILKRISDRA
jgi:predicted kinase